MSIFHLLKDKFCYISPWITSGPMEVAGCWDVFQYGKNQSYFMKERKYNWIIDDFFFFSLEGVMLICLQKYFITNNLDIDRIFTALTSHQNLFLGYVLNTAFVWIFFPYCLQGIQ